MSDTILAEEDLTSPGALAAKRVKTWGAGMMGERKGKGPLDIGKLEELKVRRGRRNAVQSSSLILCFGLWRGVDG